MLRIIKIYTLVIYAVLVGKDNIIDEFGDNKVIGAKINIKTAKSKRKNLLKPYLAKCISLI